MMCCHPHYNKPIVNNDIDKFLKNKVHDVMYNVSIHLHTHCLALQEGEVKVEPEIGSIIWSCATYMKNITMDWVDIGQDSRVPKYMQNSFGGSLLSKGVKRCCSSTNITKSFCMGRRVGLLKWVKEVITKVEIKDHDPNRHARIQKKLMDKNNTACNPALNHLWFQ